MGIELQEALEVGLISNDVYNNIPKNCIYGKRLILSDSLKSLSCSDKNCKNTRLHRYKSNRQCSKRFSRLFRP